MKKKAAVKCRSEQPGPIVILGGAEHGPPLVEFMKARMKAEVRFMWLGLPKVSLLLCWGGGLYYRSNSISKRLLSAALAYWPDVHAQVH